MFQIHQLVQGSPEWDQFRRQHHGASEAAAMLGISPTTRRTELLKAKHTGLPREFSQFVQERVLDKGHEVEALARPIVEEIIGDDLFPVTCSRGKLSASCDGLTMDRLTAFEHKQWNAELAAQVSDGQVPEHHMAQCQQILYVTGAQRVIFAVSNGTREKFLTTTVEPDDTWFERLERGWEQFEADLAAYTPAEPVEPKPTGRTPDNLPALRIEISGEVRASNLQAYREHALAVFSSINRELSTDQQFADAEKTVKWCQDVEDRLAAAKQHALSQTASIDELFRTIDAVSAEARRVRLDLDKLVKARKEAIRGEIVAGGVAGLRDHIAAINARLGKPYMPNVPADFAGVIKGKRSIDSLRDAVDSELARAKIAASEIADRIDANLKHLREKAGEHPFLFADAATIVLKAPDDLRALVSSRIADHERAEAARLERERERIRAEEQARADREARDRQAAADAEAQRQAQAAIAAAATPAAAPVAQPQQAAPVVVQRPAATSDSAARIKLGQINDRIAPLSINADGLAELGFEPVATERASKLYREADFPAICAAIVERVRMAAALQAA
ncbi:YqaJ viral recombinase family protein [Hydrogenophaga sp. T2]|uniref:YqaJ viral recombinase family protein n=1 Tax=Hydrogenophaga sp. T2 TaxID=3132823 RepID=UPI003CE9453D